MIDSIIKILPHAPGCASQFPAKGWGLKTRPVVQDIRPCNCRRRDQVAYLERLKEPTKEMRKKLMDWLLDTDNIRQNDDGWGVIIETVIVPDFATRLLKAAEESQ